MNISPVETPNFNSPFPGESCEVMGRMTRNSPFSMDDDNNDDDGTAQKPCADKQQESAPKKTLASKQDEKKKRRKKKWKKPKDKPNRPLSAYNLFFQSERALMLGDDAPTAEQESLKKRVHCKTHGKIGFAEMARHIGAKWKNLEPEKKKLYEDQARKEKERYATELATWKEAQKEKSAEGESSGLEAIAAAAVMASDPIQGGRDASFQHLEGMPSDSLRYLMADEIHRRNLSMLRNRSCQENSVDLLRALRDHQDRVALLGLSHLESSLMGYPSAAEASANAIMQQFQGFQRPPSPPLQSTATQAHRLFEADRLSQLAFPAPANQANQQVSSQQQAMNVAAMRRLQQRYLAGGNMATNDFGLCI